MKMRWICFVLLLMVPFMSLQAQHGHGSDTPGDTHASDVSCAAVLLVEGWARATVSGAPTGAVYGYVANTGPESDTLIGGSTDAASAVEIHTMTVEDEVMRMRPLEDGLIIAPHGFAELAPGGLHIMLVNLAAPLEAGSTLDLVLTFEKAGDIAVTVPVREFDVMAMDMSGDDHDGEMMDMHGDDHDGDDHDGDDQDGDDHDGDDHDGEMMDMHGDDHDGDDYDGDDHDGDDHDGDDHDDDAAHDTQHVIAPTVTEGCASVYGFGLWARPAAEGTPTSAVYGLFVNLTAEERTLISAATDAAEAVEIHQTSVDENDVMRMRPLVDGLLLPVGKGVQLKSGGLHMMLVNPARELVAGESLDVTLTFDDGSTLTLTVPIVDPALQTPALEAPAAEDTHESDHDHSG